MSSTPDIDAIEAQQTAAARKPDPTLSRFDQRQTSDNRMIAKAAKKGWIKQRYRRNAAKFLNKVVVKAHRGETSERSGIAASRVLVSADTVDAKREKNRQSSNHPQGVNVNVSITNLPPDERRARLTELAERLGARSMVVDGRAVAMAVDSPPAGGPSNGGAASDQQPGGIREGGEQREMGVGEAFGVGRRDDHGANS